jgi:hypothetical protein
VISVQRNPILGDSGTTTETVRLYHYGDLDGRATFTSPPGYPRLTDCDIANSQEEAAEYTGAPITANLRYKYELVIDRDYFDKNFRDTGTRKGYSEYVTKQSIPTTYFNKVATLTVKQPPPGGSSPTGGIGGTTPPVSTGGGSPGSSTGTPKVKSAGGKTEAVTVPKGGTTSELGEGPVMGQGRGRLTGAAEADEAEEFEGDGGGTLGGVGAVVVEVIGPLLQAFAWALVPALANQLWEQDKKKLEAAILERLNQPESLRRIADYQIDQPGLTLYANVTVEIVTEDAIQTVGTTQQGFPILNATSYYASSRLIDVKTSESTVNTSKETLSSRNLPGQSTTVHTVTETYSFALPELENRFVRARLKERIAELDQEMAKLPSQGDRFSLQLARDQLAMRLELYQSD